MGLFDKLSLLGEDKIDKYNYVLQTITLDLYVVKYYIYQNERNVVFEVETFTKFARERKEFVYPRNQEVCNIESNFKRDFKDWTDSIINNIMTRLYF